MDSIYRYIEKHSSDMRKEHINGVINTADDLATRYGADKQKTKLAALCHDLYRGVKDDALNIYVKQLGLPKKYLDNANLAHAKIAAEMIKKDFGIEDECRSISYNRKGRHVHP
jgi:HD superfamily phosphohydrolase YqeK